MTRHPITLAAGILLFAVSNLHAVECPNIVFIAIDDIDDWTGFLGGHPQVKTPNMDALKMRTMLRHSNHR